MFSYYQMDRANINKCEWQPNAESTASIEATSMVFTLYFASTYFAAIKLVFRMRPLNQLDKGPITTMVTFGMTVWSISSLLVSRYCQARMLPKTKRPRR